MFLRSITIRGFKSFADKTTLEFVPGVSVIVGPNGSGKSNLVDAISWALGEQGPRALRGGQMADVVFAGTPSRPALGMAEVKLTIDNSAGKIPVPMSEIEVSRTIFRSGESEYRIGTKLVRLMDVQELLSETGIGRALHTVVGQGQLEEVLLARPEDRRKYIEEAAGIAKHRRRKERAERKLAGLDQDLLRLGDVLAELRRQLKPLQQQAEMAKKHESLSAQAEDLAQLLAAARLRALRREEERRREGWDQGLRERTEARERLDALDGEVLEAADTRADASGTFAEADRAFRVAAAEREDAEVAYRAAVDHEATTRERAAAGSTSVARQKALADEVARGEGRLASIVEELATKEAALDAAEDAFRREDERRRAIEEERRRIGEEEAGRRGELQTLERSLTEADRERSRLAADLNAVRQTIAGVAAERETLEADIEQLDGQSAPLADKHGQLEDERRRLVERVEELEAAERGMRSRKELLDARLGDIEETPGSRFLANHRGRAVGLLKDLVKAQPELERAVVAALGPLADAVVYEDPTRALEDATGGDGAILAIAAGGPVPLGIPGERALLSIVDAAPAARGIVSTVLKDVYLADTLDDAAAKHAASPNVSFVTREGILVGPAVIRTAREADARAREIRAELKVLAHDLSATHQQLRPRRDRIEQIATELEFLREQIDAADSDITSAAERLATLDRDLAGLRREEDVLAQRVAAIDANETAWRNRLTALGPPVVDLPELPPWPRAPIQARVAVETLRQARHQHDLRLAQLRAERDELTALDPHRLGEELKLAVAARAAAEAAARSGESVFHAAAATRDAAAAAEREAAERAAAVNSRWRQASTALARLRERYEEEDRQRGDIERRIAEAERLLREGFGADPDGLLERLREDDTVESLEKKQELVQRRLGLIGRVNLLAAGEFEVVQERHDFMQRELDDVRRARRDLLEVIAQVDREITQTFDSAFRDVAVQFERLIGDLFPGGLGRLLLTDPANPLASGIEIEASPGRKRVKRISLLSGGERSLTALAFLFAIFTARPSPFYLMDEVEPALDDVNLQRFLQLVGGFAGDSQVLIVTHQKRTMEIAGMLYGISLNKDGTTKVVAQRLDQRDVRASDVAEATRVVEVPQSEPVG